MSKFLKILGVLVALASIAGICYFVFYNKEEV